jgi:hypothetical protein
MQLNDCNLRAVTRYNFFDTNSGELGNANRTHRNPVEGSGDALQHLERHIDELSGDPVKRRNLEVGIVGESSMHTPLRGERALDALRTLADQMRREAVPGRSPKIGCDGMVRAPDPKTMPSPVTRTTFAALPLPRARA